MFSLHYFEWKTPKFCPIEKTVILRKWWLMMVCKFIPPIKDHFRYLNYVRAMQELRNPQQMVFYGTNVPPFQGPEIVIDTSLVMVVIDGTIPMIPHAIR